MAYSTFTNALTQAKRNSLLKQTPFTTRDMRNLHSGYMQTAGQRVADERSYNLGNQSLKAQQNYWSNQLANERDISGLTLAQQLEIAKAGWENDNTIATNTNKTNTDINTATNTTNTNINDKNIAANTNIANTQAAAADKASQNQLTGNILTGAAGLGGAYLLSGSDAIGRGVTGIKNLVTGGGGSAVPTPTTTTPTNSLLTQEGPYLTEAPGLTPTSTQPLQASQAVTNTGNATLVPGDTVTAATPTATPTAGAGGGGSGASLVPGDAGSLAGVSTDTIGTVNPLAGDAGATGGMSGAGGAANVAGAVLAVQALREGLGGKGKGFDEKTWDERMFDRPAISTILPGTVFDSSGVGKELHRLNSQVSAPIDYLAGGALNMIEGKGLTGFWGGGGHGISPDDKKLYMDGYNEVKALYEKDGVEVPTFEQYVAAIGGPRPYMATAQKAFEDQGYYDELTPTEFVDKGRTRVLAPHSYKDLYQAKVAGNEITDIFKGGF